MRSKNLISLFLSLSLILLYGPSSISKPMSPRKAGDKGLFQRRGRFRPMNYETWKRHKENDVRNRIISLSNSLKIHKRKSMKSNYALQNLKIIKRLQHDRMKSERHLKVVQSLSFEDYVNIYLKEYRHNAKALHSIANKLSDEEVLKLLEGLLSKSM